MYGLICVFIIQNFQHFMNFKSENKTLMRNLYLKKKLIL